ncbi:unnamed protein product, partial [Rotaria socialis]
MVLNVYKIILRVRLQLFVCTDCFFGHQCQFYAKGLGLTLDEILGYEIKHNLIFTEQP